MRSKIINFFDSLSGINILLKVGIVFFFAFLYFMTINFLFSRYPFTFFSQIYKPIIIIITWLWGYKFGFLSLFLEAGINSIIFKDIILSESVVWAAFVNIFTNVVIIIFISSFRSLHYRSKNEVIIRKNLEKELKKYQNKLEDLVKSKTLELEQTIKKLHHVEKMEAIGQLAEGIAHDFNNQLTCILGYAELFKIKFQNDEVYSNYVNVVFRSCKATSRLTSQLLAFARKGKNESLSLDIHKTITEALLILSRSIDKRIVIREKLYSNKSIVDGDPGQLQNVIINLSINARDAMQNNGILTIETETAELSEIFCKKSVFKIKPGKYIKISVSDTGTGISRDVGKHIFEPFFTTKGRDKGTGMGLAAVYGTIENHNGAIEFTSTVGKGTTFYIYLPLSHHQVDTKSDQIFLKKNVSTDKNILVVDDEPEILVFIKELLENEGYSVTLCDNGNNAIQYYSKYRDKVDIVILDMIMPDLSGTQTFETLKKINNKTRVIIMTGFTIDKETNEILKKGALSILKKPFTRLKLLHQIQIALSE